MSNTGSVVNDEAEDPTVMDAVTKEEDNLIPVETMMEDDCQDDNSYPNNAFCFTEDDFIDSVINMNDATRHRSNYNSIWDHITKNNTIQYNTIQYKTIPKKQYNTKQYKTKQYKKNNTIQNNTIQHNTAQYSTTKHNTSQYNRIEYNTM